MLDTLTLDTVTARHMATAAEETPAQVAFHRQRTRPRGLAAPATALRLTRRGRVTVLVTFVTLLLVAFSVGRVMSNAATTAQRPPATHTVVVSPGDTAWSIARQAMPKLDPREAVDRLLAMNHSDGTIRVGQSLVVPGS